MPTKYHLYLFYVVELYLRLFIYLFILKILFIYLRERE